MPNYPVVLRAQLNAQQRLHCPKCGVSQGLAGDMKAELGGGGVVPCFNCYLALFITAPAEQ